MIGVFDSGNGGLSVLQELLKALPHEKYIYYADLAHCPYGEKTREYVVDRALSITRGLLDEGCNMIVIACNTATAAAISALRSEFPSVPFVGIEPAIKPAALHTSSGVVGVLATAGTLKGSNYLDLRERYSSDSVRVVEHVGEGFVELVEDAFSRAGTPADACGRAGATTFASLIPPTASCGPLPFMEPRAAQVPAPETSGVASGAAGATTFASLIPPTASCGSPPLMMPRAAQVPAPATPEATALFGTELAFGPEAEEVVRKALQPLLEAGADNIVLGCTHYPFLSKIIADVAGAEVAIINPAPAVAAQAARLLPCSDNLPRPIVCYRKS